MDSISCSICLDLLKDPVTIPCGHSYCKGCIKGYWSLDDQKGIHSCPQCRQTFTPRPALNRNILLAELVEKLKTDFKTVPSASCVSGPEDVKCDRDDSAAERTEKQGQLREKRQQVGLRIFVREKEMQDIRQAVMSLSLSAQAAVEHCELVFAELIRSIERRRCEVKELISAHQRAAVSQAEGLLVRMEQEIAELKRRDKELEQLAQTEDNIHFLKTFQSLCVAPGSELLPYITANQHFSFEEVKSSISGMMERLEDVLKEEMVQIPGKVTAVSEVYVLSPRPELMAAAEVHFIMSPRPEWSSWRTTAISRWIPTRRINTCVCLSAIEKCHGVTRLCLILTTQTDSQTTTRCCVKRICLEPATVRWIGGGSVR
ncbi:E3 ubiquitin-protein ligase TRIM65-like [Oncorhynchus nerka]|uniref:E3 ubiquitin-protein ligase TRIM65-like n=1 Tax=Oncorhynchus nerka TaxID=8023 RepID=UPI0031B8AD7F